MEKILIQFNKEQQEYPIIIGADLIKKFSELFDLTKYSKIVVITDEVIQPLFLDALQHGLPNAVSLVLPSGEKEKHMENVQKILKTLHEAGCDRKSLVINLGGGVITDMGGFAASIYMRGIDFINIPTTLLSQVDASVGGKTGIDFNGIKNLVGTFDQPTAVVIDTDTLKTLPEREFVSGFGEIIKHGLIADKEYFEKVTGKKPKEFSESELIDIITVSCQKKARVVEDDEKEGNKRKILNFGHTIGHAIESLSLETNTPLLHGEAVSIGMVAEARISELQGFISHEEVNLIENVLNNAELPTKIAEIKIDDIKMKMLSDKKNLKGEIRFVLIKKIGEAVPDCDVTDVIVTQALSYILQ